MRIILTGSRSWSDIDAIRAVLLPLLAEHPGAVLVHGDAPGADSIGRDVWRAAGGVDDPFRIERAQWDQECTSECNHGPRRMRQDGSTYCPAVGNRRNQRMADSGADLCVAFRANGRSSGTDDMVKRAQDAGIPVDLYRPGDQPRLF